MQNSFLERQKTNFVKVGMKKIQQYLAENEFFKSRNEKNTTIFSTTELNVEESDRMPLFPATQN